jgi:hypothetical protein
MLYVICGLLDITAIRILRLVSKHLRTAATACITRLSYDVRLSPGALLQSQLRALPHLKSLYCTFSAAQWNLFEILNQVQVPKLVELDLTSESLYECNGELPNVPCNGLTGLIVTFDWCSALRALSEFTELRSLELRPSLGWPNNSLVGDMLSLTGLTQLKWVNPGYNPPGPLENGLAWFRDFTNLRVLCGPRIWSEHQLRALVALTRLTHLEFEVRRVKVSASQLTSLTMVKKLGVEIHTGSQDSKVVCAELMSTIGVLTQLEDLRLAGYDQLGQLGSSLRNITSLTLSSQVRYGSHLQQLATFNLAKLVCLSVRLYQGPPPTLQAPSSWSVLAAATQLEDLVLDVHVRGDGRNCVDMVQALGQLTTLRNLKLVLDGHPSVQLERRAIESIAKLKRLSSLALHNIPNISFGTMKGILPLTSLTELRIQNFSVTTDKGFECLTGLTNLAVLGRPNTLCERHTEMLRPLMEFQYRRGMRVVNGCYHNLLPGQ